MLDSQVLKDSSNDIVKVVESKRSMKSQRDKSHASSRHDRKSDPASPTGLPTHHRLVPRHTGEANEQLIVRTDSVLDNLAQQVHRQVD